MCVIYPHHKAFFQTIGSIAHTKNDLVLPDYTSLTQMQEKFSNYFVDNKFALDQSNYDARIADDERITPSPELSSFIPGTVDEVVKLIKQSATKSCQLDPTPTHLLKENLEAVAPIFCDIVNLSLKNGIFPTEVKIAIVRPLIKKSTLDKNILKQISHLFGKSQKKLCHHVSRNIYYQIAYMNRNSLHIDHTTAPKQL